MANSYYNIYLNKDLNAQKTSNVYSLINKHLINHSDK